MSNIYFLIYIRVSVNHIEICCCWSFNSCSHIYYFLFLSQHVFHINLNLKLKNRSQKCILSSASVNCSDTSAGAVAVSAHSSAHVNFFCIWYLGVCVTIKLKMHSKLFWLLTPAVLVAGRMNCINHPLWLGHWGTGAMGHSISWLKVRMLWIWSNMGWKQWQ